MNEDVDQLEQLYRGGHLILVVGPDLSTDGGLATPLELARRLLGQLREIHPGSDFNELEAQIDAGTDDRALGALRHHFGNNEFIRRTKGILAVPPADTPELAQLITGVANGLHAIYTTNLDRLLDIATGWWSAAEGYENLPMHKHALVKLCGTLGRPETWVLTDREFDRAYGRNDVRQRVFESAYRSFPMLFIGFDQGPALLRRLVTAVSPAHAGNDAPRHFLATNLASYGHEARRELEERGLRLVSAENIRVLLRSLASDDPGHESVRPHPRPPSELPNPYPGLEPYTEELANFFYGRDEELARATGMLGGPRGQRWLSVEGPSGVGKSSFVRAGLVCSIKRGHVGGGPTAWKVLAMRPGKRPLLNLATQLCRVLEIEGVDGLAARLRHEHGLSGTLRESMPAGIGLLLIVDQLEELITFSNVDERGAFADALADALADVESPLYLVTTLRSDFVGEFAAQEHVLARTFDKGAAHHNLRAMSEAELREVVVRPAKTLGVGLQDRLLERILLDAVRLQDTDSRVDAGKPRRSNEGALPLIAHVLRGLWERGSAKGLLTLEDYEWLGGISGALTRSANSVLESLPDEDARKRAREVLQMLVNVDPEGRDTRRARAREEVLEKAGGGELGRKLLMHLSGNAEVYGGDRRLLVRLIALEDGPQPRVDLVHEALTSEWATMRGWLAEGRRELVRQGDLARNVRRWVEQRRPWLGLPGGSELKWMLRVKVENDDQRAYQRRLRVLRRARVGVVGVVAAGLGTLAFVSSVLYVQAQFRLEQAAALAETVATTIDRDLQGTPGTVEIRRKLLGQTRELLEELYEGQPENAAVNRARFADHRASGDLAYHYDNLDEAQEEYEAALVFARRLVEMEPESVLHLRDLGISFSKLGTAAEGLGHLGQARANFDNALVLFRAVAETDRSNATYRRDVRLCLNKLAAVETAAGRIDQALYHLNESVQISRILVEEEPDSPQYLRSLSVSLALIAEAKAKTGLRDEALAHLGEALMVQRALTEAHPDNLDYRRDVAVALGMLGELEASSGRLGQARAHFVEALGIEQTLVEADPSKLEYQRGVAVCLGRLGDVEMRMGLMDQSRARIQETLVINRTLAEADPNSTLYRRDIGVTLEKLGEVENESGRFDQARAHFNEALELRRALVEADPSNAESRRDLGVSLIKVGQLEVALGRLNEARAHFDEALGLQRSLAEANPNNVSYRHDVGVSLENLGEVDVALGGVDDARAHFGEALAIHRALAEADPSDGRYRQLTTCSLEGLGVLEAKLGRHETAHIYFDEALLLRTALAEADPTNAEYAFEVVLTHMKMLEFATEANDEAAALKHLDAADQYLHEMEAAGQLDGFEQRRSVRERVNQLMETSNG